MGRGLEASEDRLKGYGVESNNITCISWHPQMKVFACGRSDSSIVVYSCPLGAWCAKLTLVHLEIILYLCASILLSLFCSLLSQEMRILLS